MFAKPMRTGALASALLLGALPTPDRARAQTDTPASVEPDTPPVDVSPTSVRLAELETLRQRERGHMATRRRFAYGVLGGGVVLTVGVAVALRHICVIYCDGRPTPGERAGAGLVVVGLTTVVVSALAVAAYTGSVRAARRRMFELSVTPTASLRSVGAQLDLAW
jgi:hypothetical protein